MTIDEQRRLEQRAYTSLNEADCPQPDLLAAYALGLLNGNDQLIVAAHVRSCPLCSHDVEICRPPAVRRRMLIARLMPLPLLEAHRSIGHQEQIRRYMAADVSISLTVAPPLGDYWRITGQVMRAGSGLPECTVTLRAKRRRYTQVSDDLGFFTFLQVPEGRYTLTVVDGQVEVQVRGLELNSDSMVP